jgi:hypothetical protein
MAYVYICICVCMPVYVHVCMYVCMFTYTCQHISIVYVYVCCILMTE